MDGETLQQKTPHKERSNSQLQHFQRQEGGGECIWNIVSRFTVLLGTIEQRPRVVRDIAFTCVVLHNMLRTRQGRAPTPANDVPALQSEQVVYVPIDNYMNPSSEAKHQGDQLKKTTLIMWGH